MNVRLRGCVNCLGCTVFSHLWNSEVRKRKLKAIFIEDVNDTLSFYTSKDAILAVRLPYRELVM